MGKLNGDLWRQVIEIAYMPVLELRSVTHACKAEGPAENTSAKKVRRKDRVVFTGDVLPWGKPYDYINSRALLNSRQECS